MGIETDKLCYGKQLFESYAGEAMCRAGVDGHSGFDIAIMWADGQMREQKREIMNLRRECAELCGYDSYEQMITESLGGVI